MLSIYPLVRVSRLDVVRRKALSTEKGRFPFGDVFEVENTSVDSATVIRLLDPFLSEARKQRIQKVVSERTFNLVPVVEVERDLSFWSVGLINNGNVAAVMRSADGADKWLHRRIWSTPEDCLHGLKSLGYRVLAADASEDAIPIHEVDWSLPTAVVFGNEGVGVSPEILEGCDQRTVIPMSGFVESYNISVAAAIVLYEARRCRLDALTGHGDLTPHQQCILQAVYYLKHRENTKDVLACELQRRC